MYVQDIKLKSNCPIVNHGFDRGTDHLREFVLKLYWITAAIYCRKEEYYNKLGWIETCRSCVYEILTKLVG